MRISKPNTESRDGRHVRQERRRWDDADANSLSLGCRTCCDYEVCGGLHKEQRDFDCLGDCSGIHCLCDNVCPRNPKNFVRRFREVDGFELSNVPRVLPVLPPRLPSYIPFIFHGNRRESLLDYPVVALPLHRFYSRKTGEVRFRNRYEVSRAFKIKEATRIILIGSGRDKAIEAWWGLEEKRKGALEALLQLGIESITSPNYSLFTDVPRHDNLYNIKRGAIAWSEAVDSGLSSALHINGRTYRDYERLTQFIRDRAEVMDVAFEFGTGAAWPRRLSFHNERLKDLALGAGRPLRLIMIGGVSALPSLSATYPMISYVDTTPFMKSLHRQKLTLSSNGCLQSNLEETEALAPVDRLLVHNIAVAERRINSLIISSEVPIAPDIGQKLENPGNGSSARALPTLDPDSVH